MNIVEETKQTTIVQCIFWSTSSFKVGSVTRIVDHLLGRPGVKACTGDTDAYLAAVESLRKEEDAKQERKRRKVVVAKVADLADNTYVAVTSSTSRPKKTTQTPLLMKRCSGPIDADDAVARFFFGNNIPTQVVYSKTFKDLVQNVRTAPLDWQPPSRQRLAGRCLENLGKSSSQASNARSSVA